jgi:hypothetical protein
VLGIVADARGITYAYWLCSFLPLLGLFTVLLPRITGSPEGVAEGPEAEALPDPKHRHS